MDHRLGKKALLIVISFAIIIVAIGISVGFGRNDRQGRENGSERITDSAVDGTAEIICFGLTDADAILLKQGDNTILIDTGEEKHGNYLVDSLKKEGVSDIDYLILTHPDKDHIGGAAKLLDEFSVGTVIQSFFDKGSERQMKLRKKFAEKNIVPLEPKEPEPFDCGNFRCIVYPPEKENYAKDNNYSLIISVSHGEVNMLFAGDALKKRLKEAMNYDLPQMDLYKVAHHGRENALSGRFVRKIAPRYAVITSDHGDEELLAALESLRTAVYYTSGGDVRFFSDGETLHPAM